MVRVAVSQVDSKLAAIILSLPIKNTTEFHTILPGRFSSVVRHTFHQQSVRHVHYRHSHIAQEMMMILVYSKGEGERESSRAHISYV